jgi:hypothetical protein
MSMERLANKATAEILTLLNGDKLKADEVTKIIEAALADAINDTSLGCHEAVNICCSADQDMAHKIRNEMGRKTQLLISNLMSMR